MAERVHPGMAGRETSGVASTHTDNRLPHRRRGRKVVRAIEENGGWVVGYENCTGAKATEQCVEETGDVYDALTDKYLAIGCSCISPNDQRLKMLSQMVEEYQADGVVDVILQACHTYAVESLAIKRHVRQQHNIPYIAN